MNGFQNGKNRNHDKASPGCLGRMVNLFDLNSGVARNRLLTDKPHCDGPLVRSQSDVMRFLPSEDQVDETLIVSDLKRTSSNRNSNGTPMKMLIAQEMSKEIDPTSYNPPSVVAKLMGLDAFPMQKSVPPIRSHFGGHSRCHTDSSFSYFQHENDSLVYEMQHEFHEYAEKNEYKDVYEARQHSPKMNCVRSKSPDKARRGETGFDKKSAFVRQKFIEAKCLSMDEQLRQSREFQDALDVLSSNRDLFLKFLQEPNPMFSQHLYNVQSIPPPETKRITVLKPSKMVEDCKFGGSVKKNEQEINRVTYLGQGNRLAKHHMSFSPPAAAWSIDENHAQPTRIVVLKPSISKTHNSRAASSSPSASPRVSQAEKNFLDMEANEAQESREVATVITQQMRVNIGSHQREETLLSSVFSNGYVGDESSFNKSEKEYAAENLSDSEVMSPASRHSSEYTNRFGSPYCCSSLSHASYSPGSSVSKEAKKRLSERWAMVASNGSCQEQKQMRRSSSTLGEMLALSDIKTSGNIEQESAKEDPQISNSNLVGDSKDDESINKSPRNLLRSNPVPVSSTAFSAQLNVCVSESVTGENNIPKQTRDRSTKSSLKGKVSNLLFSRNKKPSKDGAKCLQSNDELQSGTKPLHHLSKVDKYSSECLDDPGVEGSGTNLHETSATLTLEDLVRKQGTTPPEVVLCGAKSLRSGHPCENQDQPSPMSVLEVPFEEDEHPARISSDSIKLDRYAGNELPLHPTGSNLIDKSPPIGSIARTLSWDDCCADTASSVCVRPSPSTQRMEEVEQEWFSFVQTLLTVAGLDEVQSDAFSNMWHSSESPLDPSIREKYIDLNEKETLHEAKRRQRRSTQKLVFDCVNAALIEIAGYGPDNCQRAIPFIGVHNNLPKGARLILVDQVWDRMKEWFSSEAKYLYGDGGALNSLVVEGMVRKEVMGKWWLENLRLELDNVGMEIEVKLLEELVHESVIEFAGRV